jgi:O-antigen ligase
MSKLATRLEDLAHDADAEVKARSFLRQGLTLVILLAVLITTRPFSTTVATDGPPTGDLLNQLIFSGLAVASGMMLFFLPRQALRPLLQPSWILLVGWLAICVLKSDFPGISFRSFAFTLIVIFLAAMVFVLPERLSQFQKLLIATVCVTLGLSYFGVIALPDLGRHTDFDPFEPEHSGSWRGHFFHKNTAGSMMGCYAIIAIFIMRAGYRKLGAFLLVLSVVFLFYTKSKTALALLPAVLILAFLAERIRSLPMRIMLTIGPLAAFLVLTLGSALVPVIADFNRSVLKDPSFTGRFDIWRFGFEKLIDRLWTGHGFEAFWLTDTTLRAESKLELAWAAEKIVNGHNSYLDMALTTGLIGLALTLYVFVIKPVIDFHRCDTDSDTRQLAAMFLGVWLFISLNMCLEVYYFRRADPVWFLLLLAVIGLRFIATFPVNREPSQAD